MEIIDNIPVWGAPVDDGALKQIKTCYYIFGQAAMMADHHKGYGVPIGGVIAHETLVSPSGVGYDIGCGNKAVLTDADAALRRCRPHRPHPGSTHENRAERQALTVAQLAPLDQFHSRGILATADLARRCDESWRQPEGSSPMIWCFGMEMSCIRPLGHATPQ